MRALPIALLLAVLMVRNLGPPIDFDVWYHVRIGQEIQRTGAVPHYDTLTGAADRVEPHYYVNDEWGMGWLCWQLYRSWGYAGLAWGLSGLIGLLALAVFLACRAGGVPALPATLSVLLADALMQTRYALRPHLVTQLLAAAMIAMLLRAERSPRWLWGLPPLFVLWSNVHAGVSLGVGLLGLWWIGSLSSFGRFPLSWRQLAPPTIGCLVALLCRPDGHKLPMYVLTHFRRPQVYEWVMEWQPLARVMPDWWMGPLPLYLLLALVGFLLAWRQKCLKLPYLFACLALSYFSFRWVRALGELGAVGVPLMAATWASLNFPERLTKLARSPLLTLLLSLLLGLLLARECTRPEHFRFEPGRHIYPVGAVEFLERHPARVIFNSNQFGGYLVFRHQKPFFHSVMSAIADPLLRDYFALRQNPESLSEMVSRYGLDAFLLHYEYFDDLSRLIAALDQSPDWDLVYFDDVAVLYMPSRLGLPAYRALHPGRPDPLGPDPLAARAELERYLAESPGVARGWLLWAVLGERTGDAAMQAEGYQKVLELAPDTVQARLGRARLRFAASDFAGAAEDAREAVRLAPGYAPARFNLAVALAAQNDLKGARRELDRCLQLDPGFQPAIELKNRLTSSP